MLSSHSSFIIHHHKSPWPRANLPLSGTQLTWHPICADAVPPPPRNPPITSYQYLRPSSPLAVTAAILARTRRQDLSPHTPRRARGEESLLPPAFIHQRSIEQAAESQLPPPPLRSTNLARPDTRTARELSQNKHLIPSLWYVNHCPEGVSASGA